MTENQIEGAFCSCCEGEPLAISPHWDGVVDALFIDRHDSLLTSSRYSLVMAAGYMLTDVPAGFCNAGNVFGLLVEKQEE